MKVTEEVKINFYSVHKCGFYKFGENEAEFSDLHDVLAQLEQWSDGVELSLTKIFDSSLTDDDYPVYLVGIQNINDGWLFATWNEVPSSVSGVPSIQLDSKVGSPKLHFNGVVKNSIPGYATYFWALPKQALIASVRFNRTISGQKPMRSYIGRFMSNYMSYTIQGESAEGEVQVIGYTDLGDKKPKKVKPVFKTGAFSKLGPKKFILQNFANIRKVVRRGQVSSTKALDKIWWQNALGFFHLDSKTPRRMGFSQKAYVELEYQPTLPELTAMIKGEEEDPDVSGWDDMGFIMQGEAGHTHWLGRETASGNFDLTFDRVNEEEVDIKSLLQALQRERAKILKVLE